MTIPVRARLALDSLRRCGEWKRRAALAADNRASLLRATLQIGKTKRGHDSECSLLDWFWLALAVKLAASAGIVVTASFLVERSGPFLGAMIATLPISAGPAYVFLALEHGPAFIAQSSLASLSVNAGDDPVSHALCEARAASQRCRQPRRLLSFVDRVHDCDHDDGPAAFRRPRLERRGLHARLHCACGTPRARARRPTSRGRVGGMCRPGSAPS